MKRLTIEERAARLEERAERTLPDLVPQPTPTHLALAEALDGLLTMLAGAGKSELPPQYRAVIRALHHSKGIVAESLARTPEAEVREKMVFFRNLLDQQLFSKFDDHHPNGAPPALARPDQPPQG